VRKIVAAGLLSASILILISLSAPAYASVGLEYLGPFPLQPRPIEGQPNVLVAQGTVGNTGDQDATITLSLNAGPDFASHFTTVFSDNNFQLQPGQRRDFNVSFTFDPSTTPALDYTAEIVILASAQSSGSVASFNLDVAISQNVVPEFPSSLAILAAALILMLPLLKVVGREMTSAQRFREKSP
jgi:hypothetical protein